MTVALPVYNGERFLEEAVQSVLDQTAPPTEILVFDNCSTDNSVEVAGRMLPGAAIRMSASNLGAVANFNRAARESSGEFLLWLAADDRLLPHHLELCLRALAERPELPACLPGIRYIDIAGDVIREQSDGPLGSSDPRERLRSFVRRGRWTESYCLYRRDALLASPMFTLDYATDVLLTWWFLLRGPLAVVLDPLLEYREYTTKTVEEMAKSLDPEAAQQHWRKLRLWRRLWQESQVKDVDAVVGRVARQELLRCLLLTHWRIHLSEDVLLYLESMARRSGPGGRLLTWALAAVTGAARARRRFVPGRRA